VSDKKVGREATQGRVEICRTPTTVAVVQMFCEQAPSSKNERFVAMTKALARQAAHQAAEPDAATLLDQPQVDNPAAPAKNLLLDVVNLIRENMGVARAVRVPCEGGVVGSYVHFNYQEAALVRLEGAGATQELANDIAMHIVACKPMAIRREDIPQEVVDKEREIAREQAAQSGKTGNILDKIAEGKVNSWFGEKVLVEQLFVKDNKTKVGDMIKQAGATATRVERFKVGETV
jgi:elongation factor Ts